MLIFQPLERPIGPTDGCNVNSSPTGVSPSSVCGTGSGHIGQKRVTSPENFRSGTHRPGTDRHDINSRLCKRTLNIIFMVGNDSLLN
jgi:hypothetical protein